MLEQKSFFSKFYNGQFKEAANILEKKAYENSRNQILYFLDLGVAYFEAKDYKNAIKVFSLAEDLTKHKDYTSISEEAASFLTTDSYKDYRPLDYEKIMINVYLALSYFTTKQYEDALVECRRINNLINVLKQKGLKKIEELPLAWYLSALIYEQQKKYDDAIIDYKRTKKLLKESSFINKDIKRVKLKRKGIYKSKDITIIFFSGLIPVKRVSSYNEMIPSFVRRTKNNNFFNVNGENSVELVNLETVARKNLKERVGQMMLKNIGRVAAQAAIGYGVAKATDSNTAGFLSFLLLRSATRADTRSWTTLPQSVQVLRVPAKNKELKLNYYSNNSFKKDFKLDVNKSKFYFFRAL
jgi:uncharacterized protein